MIKEFAVALKFLGSFLGLYILLNVGYGFWIKSYGMVADPATLWVTDQTSMLLNLLGERSAIQPKAASASISIIKNGDVIVNVYEGCNGINVMIIFLSFIIAFGGAVRKMIWFIPVGLLIIHLANLLRVGGLFLVAEYFETIFYYVHKYVFSASIYLIVLGLWWWWIEGVNRFSIQKALSQNK